MAHLKVKYHTNELNKMKKDSGIHKGPAKIIQARVDNVIICQWNISPEVVRYRIHLVWAFTIVNIAIRSLEYLEESYYKRNYEEKHISPGHISHIYDDIIHLLHAEDLVIMKEMLRPGNDHKTEKRTNILNYDHFSIIFYGTPSISEAEECDIFCSKHHFYFQICSHSV